MYYDLSVSVNKARPHADKADSVAGLCQALYDLHMYYTSVLASA